MPRPTDRSRHLQQRAESLLPGGVNSPVRAFRAVGGSPPIMARGKGPHVWDADDNRYLDYLGSWGPLILGHAAPEVVAAVEEAAREGSTFGATTPREIELAELVQQAFPSMERMRFVSTGTEAVMSALRVARACTNRSHVIKFEGCYHGHADSLLVKAGSGVATLGIPGSAGVPQEFIQFTIALPYNNIHALEAAFDKFPGLIACVLVEPVAGNMGCVPPAPGFLEKLRELTAREGTLLIFDEVITGFRLGFGGAQEKFGIKPDLTTLGKIVGGGLPAAVYGGRRDIMEQVAPLGPVYQAGTLSGNPVAMAAGIATLKRLRNDPGIYTRLERLSATLVDGVSDAAREARIVLCANRMGSMFTWFFTADPCVTDWDTASGCDTTRFADFHRRMLEAGVYLPPSQFEAAFLSAAHGEAEVEETVRAARQAFGGMRRA